MSRIDELLNQLCPGGVVFTDLGSCLIENRGGGTPSRNREDYWNGEVSWASVGDISASNIEIASTRQTITPEGLNSSSSNLIPAGWVVVAVKIAPGAMRVVKADIAINQDLRGLKLRNDLDPYFLTYFFKTLNIVGNGTIVQGITNSTLEKVRVPLPPLEVQHEVVRILEQFTKLEAELEAELEARRKQYEHYRNELLSFPEAGGVRWVPVGELFRIVATPRGIPREKYGHSGEIPIVDQGQELVAGFTDDLTRRVSLGECVVFGDHTRAIKWVNFDFAPGADGTKVLLADEGVALRYAYFAFLNAEIPDRGYNRHWSVAKDIKLAIPSIGKQNEIIHLLDKFDAMVNDISIGLPAEIAARRKQYEHYRAKLLTFPEAAA